MGRYERWNRLMEMLASTGKLDVEGTADTLGVSAATVRRDFEQLAAQQMVTRTRGGAVANAVAYDLPLRYKTARHAPEKQRIGAAAADLVQRAHIVGLNGGTTTTEAARAIGAATDSQDGAGPVTIVTNALNIANELTVRPHVKIVVTGGVARPQSYELIGPLAHSILDEVALDVVLLGVDALDPQAGASAHDEGEASINRLMVTRANKVVVLTDSSKLGHRAFAKICPTSGIDVVITDGSADRRVVDALTEAGVDVQLV